MKEEGFYLTCFLMAQMWLTFGCPFRDSNTLGVWYLQSKRMFFWWELCKLPPQHWYLIDSLSWPSCNPREQVALSLSCRFQKSFEKQFATRNSYCGLWWLTYIIIVSRGLKEGENNCPVHVWSIQNRHRSQKKLDYRLKLTVSKYWIGNRKLNVYLLRYNHKRNSCSPRRFHIILQCKHVTYGSFE